MGRVMTETRLAVCPVTVYTNSIQSSAPIPPARIARRAVPEAWQTHARRPHHARGSALRPVVPYCGCGGRVGASAPGAPRRRRRTSGPSAASRPWPASGMAATPPHLLSKSLRRSLTPFLAPFPGARKLTFPVPTFPVEWRRHPWPALAAGRSLCCNRDSGYGSAGGVELRSSTPPKSMFIQFFQLPAPIPVLGRI